MFLDTCATYIKSIGPDVCTCTDEETGKRSCVSSVNRPQIKFVPCTYRQTIPNKCEPTSLLKLPLSPGGNKHRWRSGLQDLNRMHSGFD